MSASFQTRRARRSQKAIPIEFHFETSLPPPSFGQREYHLADDVCLAHCTGPLKLASRRFKQHLAAKVVAAKSAPCRWRALVVAPARLKSPSKPKEHPAKTGMDNPSSTHWFVYAVVGNGFPAPGRTAVPPILETSEQLDPAWTLHASSS